jgi:hypothetical protein
MPEVITSCLVMNKIDLESGAVSFPPTEELVQRETSDLAKSVVS